MSLICWQTGSWQTGSGVGAITIVIDAESGATPLLAEIDTFTKVFKPFLSLFFCQSDTFCVANIYLQKSADTILFSELSPQSKQRASCQCGVCGYDARGSHHSCSKCNGKMMVVFIY